MEHRVGVALLPGDLHRPLCFVRRQGVAGRDPSQSAREGAQVLVGMAIDAISCRLRRWIRGWRGRRRVARRVSSGVNTRGSRGAARRCRGIVAAQNPGEHCDDGAHDSPDHGHGRGSGTADCHGRRHPGASKTQSRVAVAASTGASPGGGDGGRRRGSRGGRPRARCGHDNANIDWHRRWAEGVEVDGITLRKEGDRWVIFAGLVRFEVPKIRPISRRRTIGGRTGVDRCRPTIRGRPSAPGHAVGDRPQRRCGSEGSPRGRPAPRR
jgi:hypothetical protein